MSDVDRNSKGLSRGPGAWPRLRVQLLVTEKASIRARARVPRSEARCPARPVRLILAPCLFPTRQGFSFAFFGAFPTGWEQRISIDPLTNEPAKI